MVLGLDPKGSLVALDGQALVTESEVVDIAACEESLGSESGFVGYGGQAVEARVRGSVRGSEKKQGA